MGQASRLPAEGWRPAAQSHARLSSIYYCWAGSPGLRQARRPPLLWCLRRLHQKFHRAQCLHGHVMSTVVTLVGNETDPCTAPAEPFLLSHYAASTPRCRSAPIIHRQPFQLPASCGSNAFRRRHAKLGPLVFNRPEAIRIPLPAFHLAGVRRASSFTAGTRVSAPSVTRATR